MPMFTDSIRGLAAALTITALMIAALVLGRDVLIPFALATVLAFILAPIVRYLVGHRVPRGAAVGLVVLTLVAVLIAGSVMFSGQLLSLTASLAGYKDNLVQKVRLVTGARTGDGAISKAAESVDQLEKAFKKQAASGAPVSVAPPVVVGRESTSSVSSFFEQLRGALGPLTGAGLTLLFAAFLLVQYHDLRDRVVRLAGTDNMAATTSAISEAGSRLSRLFLMQALLNAGFGIIVSVALAVIGVPNAVLWGVATFFLRFIPFIGSFLSAIPPILLAAAVDPGWGMAIATLALFAIGEPLVGHVVEPHILGRGVGLSPFAMVAAASFWSLVWGPIGLILAAPLTMLIVVLGRYIPRLEFMSVLLGDAAALAPAEEFYHRILSADSAAAADQLENAITETSLEGAADSIVLPGLRIAARDHRLDRLDEDQIASLRESLKTTIELTADEFTATTAARDVILANPTVELSQIIVVPARGPVDAIAATFVAASLQRAADRTCVAVEHASGLMALSAARTLASDAGTDTIILSTVGGVENRHLRLLVKRAQRDFPAARLLVCDWGAEEESLAPSSEPAGVRSKVIRKLSEVTTVLAYRSTNDGVATSRVKDRSGQADLASEMTVA